MMRVEQGDITRFAGDAVVNAANNQLQLGAGVAGAIRQRGGPSIQQECNEHIRRAGPMRVGEAVATRGGDLAARWVIHAAAMGDEPASERSIAAATASALAVAREIGASSVAFPVLGSGVGGFGFTRAAEAMLHVLRRELALHAEPEEVVLYGYTEADARELRSLLNS